MGGFTKGGGHGANFGCGRARCALNFAEAKLAYAEIERDLLTLKS